MVTADHETGGLTVMARPESPTEPVVGFRSGGHTAAPVAVFAEGPGATALTGVNAIAQVGRRLRAILGL